MEPSDRIIELLEEIRDIQKSWTEESRSRVAHSIELQERAVRRQVIGMRLGGVLAPMLIRGILPVTVTSPKLPA